MIRVFTPSPGLSDSIECYWSLSGLTGPHTELVYPTGKIQLLFHYGKPFGAVKASGGSERQPRFAVCGQLVTYYEATAEKGSGMVGVVLKPDAGMSIFDLPVHGITGCTVDLTDVVPAWKGFEGEYLDCRDDVSRISVLERFLLTILRSTMESRDWFIRECIGEILRSHGLVLPRKSMKDFDLSERSMQRIFKSRVGVSPKKYADIVRFNHSVDLLGKTRDLTTAAQEAGFYDQSHFIRDFKRFSGIAPSRFLLRG